MDVTDVINTSFDIILLLESILTRAVMKIYDIVIFSKRRDKNLQFYIYVL